jgi:hypothetical protein
VASVQKSRDSVESRNRSALLPSSCRAVIRASPCACTMVASKGPVLLSFPFPFHHPRGHRISTLRKANKAKAHRSVIHSARCRAAPLLPPRGPRPLCDETHRRRAVWAEGNAKRQCRCPNRRRPTRRRSRQRARWHFAFWSSPTLSYQRGVEQTGG